MVKIKDAILGLSLTYSALTTYLILHNDRIHNNNQNETIIEFSEENYAENQIGVFRYNDIRYPVFEGPIGPRIGSIEYHADNLTHPEKVLMTEKMISYLPDVTSRAINDLWENRENITNDITRKIESIIRGE